MLTISLKDSLLPVLQLALQHPILCWALVVWDERHRVRIPGRYKKNSCFPTFSRGGKNKLLGRGVGAGVVGGHVGRERGALRKI